MWWREVHRRALASTETDMVERDTNWAASPALASTGLRNTTSCASSIVAGHRRHQERERERHRLERVPSLTAVQGTKPIMKKEENVIGGLLRWCLALNEATAALLGQNKKKTLQCLNGIQIIFGMKCCNIASLKLEDFTKMEIPNNFIFVQCEHEWKYSILCEYITYLERLNCLNAMPTNEFMFEKNA